MSGPDFWGRYLLPAFDFAPFGPGSRVLDIGCGEGDQLRVAASRGSACVGIEPSLPVAERVVSSDVRILRGVAEELPFDDGEFDGVICKVVTPYTDERRCIQEIARVVRPGGRVVMSHHGLGYFLRYIVAPPGWKFRLYGVRSIVNTMVYRLTGRRLPGALGDTIYQSRATMQRYYDRNGLVIREAPESPRFLGAPVFIYEVLEKR